MVVVTTYYYKEECSLKFTITRGKQMVEDTVDQMSFMVNISEHGYNNGVSEFSLQLIIELLAPGGSVEVCFDKVYCGKILQEPMNSVLFGWVIIMFATLSRCNLGGYHHNTKYVDCGAESWHYQLPVPQSSQAVGHNVIAKSIPHLLGCEYTPHHHHPI